MYFAAKLVNLLAVCCEKAGLLPKIFFPNLLSREKQDKLQEISRPYGEKSLSRPVFRKVRHSKRFDGFCAPPLIQQRYPGSAAICCPGPHLIFSLFIRKDSMGSARLL